MVRPALLVVLVALPLIGLPAGAMADLRSDLQQRYRQFDQAVSTKNVRAVTAWVAANLSSGYSYTSRDKNVYNRQKFLKGLRDQIAITKKVSASGTKLTGLKIVGSVATAQVDSHTTAIVVFDGQQMRLEDKSHSVDTWVNDGKGWRLKRSVQTKADTQMYPL